MEMDVLTEYATQQLGRASMILRHGLAMVVACYCLFIAIDIAYIYQPGWNSEDVDSKGLAQDDSSSNVLVAPRPPLD